MTTGYIHSIESMGTLDGPGIRTIIFLQGCPLRCIYCHNPDTQAFTHERTMTPEEVLALANRYRTYYGTDGGITFSGGEPLAQPEFLEEALKTLKDAHITTCLDTSGVTSPDALKRILPHVGTLLFDIKALTPSAHLEITGVPIGPVDRAIETIRAIPYPGRIWIRHVMLPGVTDTEVSMDAVAERIEPLRPWIDKIQILPFHTMGADKYAELGRENPTAHIPPMDKERAHTLEIYLNDRFFGPSVTSPEPLQ